MPPISPLLLDAIAVKTLFFFCNSLEFILDILDVILFGPFLLGAFLMGILLIVDFIKCICGNWNDLA